MTLVLNDIELPAQLPGNYSPNCCYKQFFFYSRSSSSSPHRSVPELEPLSLTLFSAKSSVMIKEVGGSERSERSDLIWCHPLYDHLSSPSHFSAEQTPSYHFWSIYCCNLVSITDWDIIGLVKSYFIQSWELFSTIKLRTLKYQNQEVCFNARRFIISNISYFLKSKSKL